MLANLGVEHDGAPLSEAMVLGVGGGLGAGYILWEFKRDGYRASCSGSGGCGSTRTGGRPRPPRAWACTPRSTRPAARARRPRRSAEQLDRGLPAIVWVDDEQLGLKGEPAWREGHGGPPVVVYGRAGDGS